MYPIVKKAKQSPNYGKAYIKGDNLVVNNTTYNFDSLLPEAIHPKQFSYKENNECLLFGGPRSFITFYQINFLINSYTVTLYMTLCGTRLSVCQGNVL